MSCATLGAAFSAALFERSCVQLMTAKQYTELVEHRIVDLLGQANVEVVVATRTGLNVMRARFGASQYLRIGQEHICRHRRHGCRSNNWTNELLSPQPARREALGFLSDRAN